MKKKIIIFSILVILCIVGVGMRVILCNDNLRFKLSYEYVNFLEYSNGKKIKISIPTNNHVKYLSNQELVTFLKEGTGILYLGYNTCPWCRNALPVLLDVILEQKESLYYVDSHKLEEKILKEELIPSLSQYLKEDEKGNKVLAVPDIYFIKEGQVVGHHVGTVDSYHNPYSGMNQSQKEELRRIYMDLYEELKK